VAGCLGPLTSGATLAFLSSPSSHAIKQACQEYKITGLILVPEILQLITEAIERQVHQQGKELRTLVSKSSWLPRPVRRLIFHQLHRAFGGHLKFIGLGGSAVNSDLLELWHGLGVYALQGYGATEVCAAAIMNRFADYRHDSIGKLLGGLQAKIQDGELWISGDSVAQGYWKNPSATKQAFTDGWYRTGDIVTEHQDRFYFKDRVKNIIVLPSGKNVYPQDVEIPLKTDPQIIDAVILSKSDAAGESVHAVLILQAKANAKQIIASVNNSLPSYQHISDFSIWPDPEFPKTRSLKIDRKRVRQWLINQVTGQSSPSSPPADKLIRLVSQISKRPVSAISSQTNISQDLAMDSLQKVELVAAIELEFGVEIDDTLINQTTTIKKVKQLIKQANQQPSSKVETFWQLNSVFKALRTIVIQPLLSVIMRSWFSIAIDGRQNLPTVPAVYIFNHNSHLDMPLVLSQLPKTLAQQLVPLAAADYFFDTNWKATLIRVILNAFPMERDRGARRSLQTVGQLVERGWSIALSPEGTRGQPGVLQEFKRGYLLIAQEIRLPIVPIYIAGAGELLPKGATFPRTGRITITIGEPIKYDFFNNWPQVHQQIIQWYLRQGK
jgi:long-chain acyl-CoA synthetase